MIKQIVKLITITLIVLSLLFIGAVLFLSSSIGERYVKQFVIAQLEQATHRDIALNYLNTDFKSTIMIREFEIAAQDGRHSILSIDQLYVRYDIFDLLRKRISIETILIDGLNLDIIQDTTGHIDFPFLDQNTITDDESKSESTFPFDLQIDELRLNRTVFMYNDKAMPLETSIKNLHLVTSFRGNEDNSYTIDSDIIELQYQQALMSSHRFHLDGKWSTERLTIDSLSTSAEGIHIDGTGMLELGPDGIDIEMRLSMNGKIDSVMAKLSPLWNASTPVTGCVDLKVALAGEISNPNVDVHLLGNGITVAQVPIRHIELVAGLDDRYVEISRLLLKAFDGEVSVHGGIQLDSSVTHELEGYLADVRLSSIRDVFLTQDSTITGVLSGSLHSNGNLSDLTQLNLRSRIVLSDLTVHDMMHPELVMTMHVNRGVFKHVLLFNSSSINTTIRFADGGLDGEFSGDLVDVNLLAELVDVRNLHGHIMTHGFMRGSFNNPVVSGKIIGDSLDYNNFPMDSLYTEFVYRDHDVVLNRVEFAGMTNWSDSTDAPFYLNDTKGRLSYQGSAQGKIGDLAARLVLMFQDISYDTYTLDYGKVVAGYEDHELNLLAGDARKDSLEIRLSASYLPGAKQGEVAMALYLIDLNGQSDSIQTLSPHIASETSDTIRRVGNIRIEFHHRIPQTLSVKSTGDSLFLNYLSRLIFNTDKIRGELNFRAEGDLEFSDPDFTVSVSILKPSFESVEFDSIHGVIAIENHELELIDLTSFMGPGKSEISGRLELKNEDDDKPAITSTNRFSGNASVNDLDLHILNSFLSENIDVQGRTSFSLQWGGTLGRPHILGNIRLNKGEFTIDENTPILSELTMAASLVDSILFIESLSGEFNKLPFESFGRVKVIESIGYDGNLNILIPNHGAVEVTGILSSDSINVISSVNDFDLKLFQSLVADLEGLSGRVNLALNAEGSVKSPHIHGHIELQNLKALYPALNLSFTEGYARTNFAHNEIVIDSMFTKLNSGTIACKGRGILEDNEIKSLTFYCEAESVVVDKNDELKLFLKNADLRYETEKDLHVLRGEVTLGESKILYNFSPTSILPFARRVERPARAMPELLEKTRLELKIRESEHIWIDNNLARIRLYPELAIVGFLSGVNVRGRVTTIEGYVLYLDRKFNINKGMIDFIDPNRINPNIDIEAVADLKGYQTFDEREYKITLGITGLLDQAKLTLTSDPELARSDILALLTLGFTRDQLSTSSAGTAKEVSVSDLIKQRLEMFSSQRISYYASQKVGNLFGLDRMSIEGNLFQFGSSWGPQLLASKKITDRIELTYDTAAGELNENGIRLDYRIKNNFFIQGSTDQSGRSAIDLKFGIKFK